MLPQALGEPFPAPEVPRKRWRGAEQISEGHELHRANIRACWCLQSQQREEPAQDHTRQHEEALTAEAGGHGSAAKQIRLLLIPAHSPVRWGVLRGFVEYFLPLITDITAFPSWCEGFMPVPASLLWSGPPKGCSEHGTAMCWERANTASPSDEHSRALKRLRLKHKTSSRSWPWAAGTGRYHSSSKKRC